MILAALDHPDNPSVVHVFRSGVDSLDQGKQSVQPEEIVSPVVISRQLIGHSLPDRQRDLVDVVQIHDRQE